VNADISKLKERIALEYVHYNQTSMNVTVYMLNWGSIDDVSVRRVIIYNSTWTYSKQFADWELRTFAGAPLQNIDRDQEGVATMKLSVRLRSGGQYSLRIITARGSAFNGVLIA